MKLKASVFILFLSVFFSFSSFAQGDSTFLSRAANSLTDHFTTNPQEKVYLHLDRSYYTPGDTIWFKAYTLVGGSHQLSGLSGVLYCELINGNDSVVSRHVLKLTAGLTWGNFFLARSFKPGNYHVRAYTNWMRNAGTEYFYNQAIRIGGLGQSIVPIKLNTKPQPDFQFFPEGGELVNGVRSRVAVKAISANGLGENILGIVIDNEGNEVAEFATQHLGMGVFAIVPQAGKTYKAKITCADSSHYTADLPLAQEQGFTLSINNNGVDSIYLKVAANDKLFQAKQNSVFYLMAQSGGKVYYQAQAKLATSVFTTRISKARFPSGIVQFTLFSQNGEPLNERIIFVQNNDALQLAVASSSKASSPRQKIKIDIDTKGSKKQVATGSFSVSVTNESRLPVDENIEGTIWNNILLTSDLKGYIEQPNYYFTDINDEKRADMDVLMLTQGYHRFQWKRILDNAPTPSTYKPEKSLELTGSIKTPAGKPVPNGKIILLATKEHFMTDTLTNTDGDFKFTDIELPDTAKIVLRARKEHNGSNVVIFVKQQDYPAVIKSKIQNQRMVTNITPEMRKNIEEYQQELKHDSLKNGIALSGVTIKAKRSPKPDELNNFGTTFERDLDMNRVKDYSSIAEAIRYMAPGFRGSYLLNGLDLRENTDAIATYSINEIEQIRLIDANGYDPIKGGIRTSGYIIIVTKQYAGTDTTILKGVTIRAKKSNAPNLSNSSNLHGGGVADQVIMGDKISGCVTLSDCLQGKVSGVQFKFDGTPVNTRGGGSMSVIIDGLILDGSDLNNLNASDIYSIEVLRSGAARSVYGTSIQGGGALVITSKHANDPNYVTSETPSGLITYPFKGYYKAKAFYSPKYIHAKTDGETFDLRTTIYWNPNIITDKDGKVSFEYFNADTKGTYRVVVEGIDDNGNLGRQVFRYKVE